MKKTLVFFLIPTILNDLGGFAAALCFSIISYLHTSYCIFKPFNY